MYYICAAVAAEFTATITYIKIDKDLGLKQLIQRLCAQGWPLTSDRKTRWKYRCQNTIRRGVFNKR